MSEIGAATSVALGGSSILKNPAVHAATRAALELVVSSGVGIASIDRGLLNAATIKALSKTTFTILLPLFLGSSILKTITKYGLTKSSLAVPVLAATQSFLLYGFATRVLYPCFLSSDEQETEAARGMAVCASFGNSGVVPLIFCDSLFRKSASQNDHLELSTGFVSMFLVGWSPFFWSFGQSILLGTGGADKRKIDTGRKSVPKSITVRKGELLAFAKTLLPPPVMGVLIGMTIGTIPILRRLFVGDGSSSSSSPSPSTATAAPLGVVFDTAQNFGKAASPLSLLILVSSLALGAGFGTKHQLPSPPLVKGKTAASQTDTIAIPFWKRLAVVSLSRSIVSPALMLGMLKAASSGGWIGTSVEQPMLWFVCLLESCMPPAQNQVTMLQVANKTKQANEMATFLFSVYAASMIPLTIVISIALDKFGLI